MLDHSPRVVVVGSANIDLTFCAARLPAMGETLRGHSFHLGYGGKGANQAVMAARLGAPTSFVGRVGRDLFGDGLVQALSIQGIDTQFIERDDKEASGTAAIVVDDAARNCILVVPGANGKLSPADVRKAGPAIRAARVLLCQLETPLETVAEALLIARGARVRTILNPAPAAPLPDDVYALADLCVPNETELATLTALPASSLEEIELAARQIVQHGSPTVLVTLGARGVLMVTANATEHFPAVPVDAVDPTGAGDAFIGALGVFLAEDRLLVEAVRRANVAAALSVTRLGAQTSFPSRAEVEGLILGNR